METKHEPISLVVIPTVFRDDLFPLFRQELKTPLEHGTIDGAGQCAHDQLKGWPNIWEEVNITKDPGTIRFEI